MRPGVSAWLCRAVWSVLPRRAGAGSSPRICAKTKADCRSLDSERVYRDAQVHWPAWPWRWNVIEREKTVCPSRECAVRKYFFQSGRGLVNPGSRAAGRRECARADRIHHRRRIYYLRCSCTGRRPALEQRAGTTQRALGEGRMRGASMQDAQSEAKNMRNSGVSSLEERRVADVRNAPLAWSASSRRTGKNGDSLRPRAILRPIELTHAPTPLRKRDRQPPSIAPGTAVSCRRCGQLRSHLSSLPARRGACGDNELTDTRRDPYPCPSELQACSCLLPALPTSAVAVERQVARTFFVESPADPWMTMSRRWPAFSALMHA